jgi:hypothetical protein
MDKGDPLDSGPELHAILRAADNGLLQAIENNLDLNAGFSRLISELPEVAPADTQRSPARTGPRRAGLYAARVAGAPAEGRWLSPLAVNGGGGAAPHNRSRLIMLGLAVALALNIGVLTSLIHNSATSPQPGASGIALPANHLPHEPAIGRRFPPPRPQQVIILGSPGAFAPLGDFAAGAGIGGNPVISYLENSGKGSRDRVVSDERRPPFLHRKYFPHQYWWPHPAENIESEV